MALRWILPLSNPDVVKFTVTPTASAKTVTLENFSAPYNCFVDWGDGEKSAQITGNGVVSHTYAGTTPRQVVIRGVLGGFWNATTISAGKTLVTSVDEINSRSLVTLAHTFRGCTALAKLPATVDAPNVMDFSYAFYLCRSITSALPALWLSYPKAVHASCFTSCFKSLYGQYGTGCSYREYAAAVAGQTYYQKYGFKCPAATYHAAYIGPYTNCTLYLGHKISFCEAGTGPHSGAFIRCAGNRGTDYTYSCGYIGRGEKCVCVDTCSYNTSSLSPYYTCTQSSLSGITTCNSICKRTYTSGQSAYYKCKKSNTTCPTTNCPYPYANEASMTAAKAAGWA